MASPSAQQAYSIPFHYRSSRRHSGLMKCLGTLDTFTFIYFPEISRYIAIAMDNEATFPEWKKELVNLYFGIFPAVVASQLDEEILALEKEQDMPIEELLKLYGYNNSQKDAVEKPAEEPEKKEESDQEEIVEPDVEVEPPTEIIADASKGEKRGSSSPPPSKKAGSELAK